MARKLEIALFTSVAAVVLAGLCALAMAHGPVVLGQYSTSLRARTASQRHNAALAARALNGQVILPGQELSFNRCVGPWTADRGYERAPVSYDGELVAAWGGRGLPDLHHAV